MNISKVIILGVSQGAHVGLILGLMAPHKIKGALFCGTTFAGMEGAIEGLKRLTTNFPYVPQALQANLMMCWGPEYASETVNPTGPKGTKETDWVSVWQERYGGSPEKEERFKGTLNPFLSGPGAGAEQLASIKYPILMLTVSSLTRSYVEAKTNEPFRAQTTVSFHTSNVLFHQKPYSSQSG